MAQLLHRIHRGLSEDPTQANLDLDLGIEGEAEALEISTGEEEDEEERGGGGENGLIARKEFKVGRQREREREKCFMV